ncbi:helix-turn-helix domain-containing protein [Actinophytocola glycyrrhizae]|uniref:Helix-turn-helix domain-containing protein n=1 Tax=Actinophytocola glycyrrhizae TaxID=2044873 RepID=A0ABV9S473_9PSEU
MDAAQDDEDRAFARVLGQELRTARETKGLTRIQLVAQLPSGIGDRTLLTYEHGIRQITVNRFVEICRALGVAAAEILDQALEKARDLRAFSLRVNLTAVLRDQRDELAPIRFWAQRRIEDSSSAEVLLPPAVVRELAAALGFSHAALARYLVEFSADDPPAT